VVPAGTSRQIIDKLAAAQKQIAGEKAIQERFMIAGARVLSSSPEGALAFAAKERAIWKEVVATSGAKID
jgi:tripartite-type tricarboxylate transporter receptor subunit TctC